MALRIEEIPSLPEEGALRDSWNELLSNREDASPYETYEWHAANLRSFPNERTVILAFFDSNSQLAGLIPLAARVRRKYLRRKTWWEFAGLPFADYGTCLVRSGFEEAVAEGFLEYLHTRRLLWDGIYLDNVRVNERFPKCLLAAARKHGLFALSEQTHHVRRMTASRAGLGFPESRSLLKARKRISQLGELKFNVAAHENELHQELNDYFRMHAERSSSKGFQSQLAQTEHQAFYRNIVRLCAPQGMVWLSTLFCDGQSVASRLSMRYGRVLHLYSTCFVPAFAKYSPSMLQLEMLLKHAFQSGIEIIDFGIGDSPHKERAEAAMECVLAHVELYHTRGSLIESRAYQITQRQARTSRLLQRAGKCVREMLPFEV